MAAPEIALNLWYVRDEDGLIYSLRARAYVCQGTDGEILAFLRERAELDHQIAEPFDVPEAFHLTVVEDGRDVKYPVAHVQMLDPLPLPLFEEALRRIEAGFPAQTKLSIPVGPLICLTALQQDENGDIRPAMTGRRKF